MINQNGTLSIDTFIEKVLYDKKKGYYSRKNPFGIKGDFITAPLVSPLFSEMIAVWVISFWIKLGKPNIFLRLLMPIEIPSIFQKFLIEFKIFLKK